jgi:MFS family permease
MATRSPGLAANWRQFTLLVAVNAFVGGMVGLERSVLPVLAREEFGLGSTTAVVSFVATFGVAKAFSNLFAGYLSDKYTRRRVLIAGWLAGLPVPFLLIWAPGWGWIIGANLLLGLNQGLAWSMTVNMKIDLTGPERRGLALGLNEAAGYLSVAAAAFASGIIAQEYGLRPEPFYLGIGFAACGLALSALFVRDTSDLVAAESLTGGVPAAIPSFKRSFAETTWRDRRLFGMTQAGFITNLNDALAWAVFPLFFVSHGLELGRVAVLAAVYPLVWGSLQLATGWVSDAVGRRPLIVGGMLLQGAAIAFTGTRDTFEGWLLGAVMLGAGTAMVYPALLASVSDAVRPESRATSLGVYRFWRDAGAVAGALAAGSVADMFGFEAAIQVVAAITAASGVIAALTIRPGKRAQPAPQLTTVAG